MSDYLIREFRAQLTTTMDLALRRTMFEIMKIFEHSIHDHQMELAQKGEEIAHLKIKLQRAEIRLKECVHEGDEGGAPKKLGETTRTDQLERQPEDALNAKEQPSEIPEIDFEVPDDWCAPLGCETPRKTEEDACPSVQLRQLYIPLCHVPVIKEEVGERDMESDQQTNCWRRTRRGALLKEKHIHSRGRRSPISKQGTPRLLVRSNMKNMLQDIQEECVGPKSRPTDLGKRRGKLVEKEPKNTAKSKRWERKKTATGPKSTEQEVVGNDNEKRYSCKFCHKEFDTVFGRSVHVRTHKRCQGCKKVFPFPSNLKSHKPYCRKFQNLIRDAQSYPARPQSSDEETLTAPGTELVIIKEEHTSSSSLNESPKKYRSTKNYSCLHCNKTFCTHVRMEEHMRIHSGQKPFPCSMCPKKFYVKQGLRLHTTRIHKARIESGETKAGLSQDLRLEMTERNQGEEISPSSPVQQPTNTEKPSNPPQQSPATPKIHHSRVKRKCNSARQKAPLCHEMGTECVKGFTCTVCQTTTKSKRSLIEHFRIHTGEKPLQCGLCPATFRYSAQLTLHKKKCARLLIQCEMCERKFPTQAVYDKHMHKFH